MIDTPAIFITEKNVVAFIEQLGLVVDETDGSRYLKLPQWFKKRGEDCLLELPFKDLPGMVKSADIKYGYHQAMFGLDEMKTCLAAMVQWEDGCEGALSPSQYFRETFGLDIDKND